MRRADRLFDIVQFLRGGRLRTAQEIAERLEVSVRTIYRDIDALVLSGVPIEGERGVGYVLRGTLLLPPLAFTQAELEGLALGARFVEAWADPELADAAREALIKIDAVLPDGKRGDLWRDAIHVYSPSLIASGNEHLRLFRRAIREGRKVRIGYRTLAEDEVSSRVIRPLAIEAWGHAWTVTTWCELRVDFRTFRLDRIDAAETLEDRFRPEKGKMLKDYLDRLRARGLNRYGKPAS
ncbi:YafY family protein [Kaistia dalseonensis]|uniref:DNA-binding transcriptional regulator YafY n=1 Tax=Kaistia dalseonensis TaxID=410840 RepID=A0ABU0H1F0_9HYPH|nr:YafY family protein [Kaistia dalseonensis]MCX5493581.1 YafY family protein [Kaistia dalseonensis]MDQ0436141.1 putative DNA-binding transcriptional regulator YafY [Kaistia dalseonensis]